MFVNSYLKSATVFGVMEGYGYIWPYNTDRFDFAVYSVPARMMEMKNSTGHICLICPMLSYEILFLMKYSFCCLNMPSSASPHENHSCC